MPLFRSNKSQASSDRLTGSRNGSPTNSEADYPQSFNQQPAVYNSPQFAHDQHSDQYNQQSFDERLYQNPQLQSPPAHALSRSQSQRSPQPSDVYEIQRSNVKTVPGLTTPNTIFEDSGVDLVPGQTSFGQSKQVHLEKEHKKSKRSIFSLAGLKDKDKDKDTEKERDRDKATSPIERKPIGRSGSFHLLRRQPQVQVQVQPSAGSEPQSSPNSSSNFQSIGHSTYQTSSENIAENVPQDTSYYDQYQRPPQSQIDIFENQSAHRSPEYVEDAPNYSQTQGQYQSYHQTDSANTSEHHLPYQSHVYQQSLSDSQQNLHQNLRPPSQLSLGPPSPIGNPPVQLDSRPSTATTGRYSAHSVGQQQQQYQPQAMMARGDPVNGGMRQQMSQQRDPRGEEYQDSRLRVTQQGAEQGRSTPPLRNRDDVSHLDYHQLLQRHEELQAKYSKVKRYYFEREAQVTQLQNTIANQRLSMSKTSLDDAQYTGRFERLSGAIMNLSFNIRKNWRAIPPWLRVVCNHDAHNVGTKEMTAVGRACITRWLFESLFERIFHPGIELGLSGALKNIERNLRRSGPSRTFLTDEQRDDITTKVISWRLTTVEGLQDILGTRQADQFVEALTKHLTHQLIESLKANLTDPPPPGLNEGVSTIIDQAIGIVSNLPLESRDIFIEYYMPGTPINETYMKVESGIAPLSTPGQEERSSASGSVQQQSQHYDSQDPSDTMSTTSNEGERDVEADIREAAGKASQSSNAIIQGAGSQPRTEGTSGLSGSGSQSTVKSSDKSAKKSGFLGGFVNKKPAPQTRMTPSDSRHQQSGDSTSESQERERMARESAAIDPNILNTINAGGNNEGKIRFAVFLGVEVRGKGAKGDKDVGGSGRDVNILVKAPVYEF